MSKKHLPHDSPLKYIKTRARTLPVHECFVNRDWQESGLAKIVVIRKHVTGNITFGVYLVDIYCLGVKDTFFNFNMPPDTIQELLNGMFNMLDEEDNAILAEYKLVHNIIYGAIEYAEELGFAPHRDFSATRYILEEDDDNIELIDIEFGLSGKPAVIIGPYDNPEKIISTLNRTAGKGNYIIIDLAENDIEYEEEHHDEKNKPVSRELFELQNERLGEFLSTQNFQSLEEANEFLEKNLTGKKIDDIIPPRPGRKSNKEKAYDIIAKAYEANYPENIELAKEALEIDFENVRAMVLLAQYEDNLISALALYERAMNCGQKELGEKFFRQNKGSFWGMTQTRPFMNAKLGAAISLYHLGKWKESVKHLEELIALNPNDNQGVRYQLSTLYLLNSKFDNYQKIYKKYKDDYSAWWMYNHAYFTFRTEGIGLKSGAALGKAIEFNHHIADVLTGLKDIPKNPEDYYRIGDETEAYEYLEFNHSLWESDPEALKWLSNLHKTK